MEEIFSPWKEDGNNFLFLCKIMMFDIDVNESHDYVENAVCYNGEILRTVRTAQT
jgi:hypothetical protein